jgi:Uma2 family endonuclease
MITKFSDLDLSKSYTYKDYLTWQFKERVELILGKIFKMSPAPRTEHQYVLSVVQSTIFNFLKGKTCKVFPAPFDVILPLENDKGEPHTVVQPDITVVCDPTKIEERGCNGVPDLVVEIISKSSVERDLHEKFGIYQECGVKEYWILHPNDKTLVIHTLEGGQYKPSKMLTRGDFARSTVLPGLEVDLTEVFEDVVYEERKDYC